MKRKMDEIDFSNISLINRDGEYYEVMKLKVYKEDNDKYEIL